MTLDQVEQLAENFFEKTVDLRRQIHAYPELSFQEFQTAELVFNTLQALSFDDVYRCAKTGVVGVLKGKNSDKYCVGLRADMDALPIQELTNCSFKSVHNGIMHACGHDVHTANLLGVAMILSELKNEWEGQVKFIFQPSEEKMPSGAETMIREGVLENPRINCLLGMHVHPELEVGNVGFCAGKFMASADEIYLTVKGKGGHAAQPQNFISPLLIASKVLLALDELNDKDFPVVLSFGKIIAEGATNVIPEKAEIAGTLRCFDEKKRSEIHHKINSICKEIAQASKGECEVKILKGNPVLTNHELLTNYCKDVAANTMVKVQELPKRMGSEDFAFYTEKVPSCFYRIGVGNLAKGIHSPIHTPTFDVDENCLKTATILMSWLTLQLLKNQPQI